MQLNCGAGKLANGLCLDCLRWPDWETALRESIDNLE